MKKLTTIALFILLVLAIITSTACAKKPAEFTFSDLVLTPAEAEVWQEVTASAKVRNIGQLEGTCNVTLKIDGTPIETKSFVLAGGIEETVSFTFKRDIGPSCNVEINGLSKTLAVKEGVLPTLSIGDKWVQKFISEGYEYLVTLEVAGEDGTDGKNCYVMRGTFEPPYQGFLTDASVKFDKATMQMVRMQMSGQYQNMPFVSAVTYSYDFPGSLPYPLQVGKEYSVIETETTTVTVMGQTQTSTETKTYIHKVEIMEEITVPAGTFRCFKIVRYDEQRNLLSTSWVSDKVKGYDAKTIDAKTGEVAELVFYSIH